MITGMVGRQVNWDGRAACVFLWISGCLMLLKLHIVSNMFGYIVCRILEYGSWPNSKYGLIHLVPRVRQVEVCLQYPIHLQSMLLN
jgi:hypothetical protein